MIKTDFFGTFLFSIGHGPMYMNITLQVGRSSFTRSFAKDQVLRGPLVYLIL